MSGEDLMEAIGGGDEAGVKRELDDGADPLFADDEGFTVLHMACQEGYDAIATMLIRMPRSTPPTMMAPRRHARGVGRASRGGGDAHQRGGRRFHETKGQNSAFCASCVAGSAVRKEHLSNHIPYE